MTSDEEGFLTRWSRRKRAGETATPATPEPADGTAAPEGSEHPPESGPPDLAEVVAKLPPIEEITAATDIRAFLAPGVPTELRLAALRRAWSTDPAIRDFIGLAENQWDFNAPDGVPGFGSLLDPDQVRRLLAKVIGGGKPEAETQAESLPPQAGGPDSPVTETATAAAADAPALPGIDEPAPESDSGVDEAAAPPRRHGSALPR
jgi:hypothetical protein